MSEMHTPAWEQSLEQMARRFDYPPTPEMAAAVRQMTADRRHSGGGRPMATGRRLAWALVLLLALAAGLLAVPQTRAALLSFFARVGAIDIFIDETAPTPTTPPSTPQAAILPPPAADSTGSPLATSAPDPLPHALSLMALGEPVTLAEAERRVRFTPRLPDALGEPDEVYLHRDVDLPAVTLVWRAAGESPLSLTQIGVAEFARKLVAEETVQDVTIGDRPGIWLEGPHTLLLFGDWQPNRLLIASNVLIWVQDGITYRLEGDITLDEARRIAESVP